MKKKKWLICVIVLLVVAAAGGYLYWDYCHDQERLHPKFYSGNGRLEATEVYIATKNPGRVEKVYVKEGDHVKVGDKLVQMQITTLEAEKAEVEANLIVLQGSLEMAKATLAEKESNLANTTRDCERQEKLFRQNAQSEKIYDKALADMRKDQAAVRYAKASILSAEGMIAAEKAKLQRIENDIKDSLLVATYEGRIQYQLAHEGEVLSAGGRAMNLVNLTDVYMTFFLPTNIAAQVMLGAEVKLVFDAAPDDPVDAKVTFVDPVAQFTPKSVETRLEREKLMFRVKAHIDAELLRKYIDDVKVGLPGVAYVKLDPNADWKDCPMR